MSYVPNIPLELDPIYTGMASDLRAQLYTGSTGATAGSEISGGFTEMPGDEAKYIFRPDIPSGHDGWCRVYPDGAPETTIAYFAINPVELEPLAAPPTAVQNRQEMDTNSTKLVNLDAAVSSRLATSGYTTPPTVAAIRSEIDTNSTKLDATVSSRASQTSLSALNNLSLAQAQTAAAAALTAYGAATGANVTATQTAIINAIAALNDLSDTEIVNAIKAYEVETGHTFDTVQKRLYAVIRGRSVANDATNPTELDYYAPDNTTVRVTHTLTDVERTVA